MHKKEIDYQSLGFGSLVELMAKLPDFVLIEPPNANGDFLLKPRKIPGYYFILLFREMALQSTIS